MLAYAGPMNLRWQHTCQSEEFFTAQAPPYQFTSSPVLMLKEADQNPRSLAGLLPILWLTACTTAPPKGTVVDERWYVPLIGKVTCEIPSPSYTEIIEAYTESTGDIVFWDAEAGYFYRAMIQDLGLQLPDDVIGAALKNNVHETILPKIERGEPGGTLVDERSFDHNGVQGHYALLRYVERKGGIGRLLADRGPFYTGVASVYNDGHIYTVTKNRMDSSEGTQRPLQDSIFEHTMTHLKKCTIGVARKHRPTCHHDGNDLVIRFRSYPSYPGSAVNSCREGDIAFTATITPGGHVRQVDTEENPLGSEFHQQVIRAVMRWKFLPLCDDELTKDRTYTAIAQFRVTEDDGPDCPQWKEQDLRRDNGQ